MLNFDFLEKDLGIVSLQHFVYDFSRKMFLGITSPRPTAPDPGPRPSALGPGPQSHLLFYGPNYFFAAPMYQNYFFIALNYQNYYFTAMVVENICCISVLSKFQTFQLKEDKICN